MVRGLLLAALSVAVFGCSEQRVVSQTQLVLVADTDIRDLERIEFSVDGTAREPETFASPLRENGEPLSLALIYES